MRPTCLAAAAVSLLAAHAHAALEGHASLLATPVAGGYRYTVTLTNTGTTTVGTLWFAWVPGGNFMTSVPTAITSPAGWTGSVVGGVGAASIRWQAGNVASRLGPGGSLSTFSFESTNSPEQLAGFAPSSPTFLTTTSFLYSGGAFSDSGYQFVAAIPGPTQGVSVIAMFSMAALRRRRAV